MTVQTEIARTTYAHRAWNPPDSAVTPEASDRNCAMSTLDVQAAAARWVDDHGECLYRYALVRVRKPEVAEDLVQETFLAAVRGYEARMALRECLEMNWLDMPAGGTV